MRMAAIMVAAALGGCMAPVTGLKGPDARLMRAVAPLPDIPKDEAKPEVRRRYYATSRRMYGQCSDQVGGLQAYARTVAPQAVPAKGVAVARK